MNQGVRQKTVLFIGAAFLALVFLSFPRSIQAQSNPMGNISGNIYAQDGTTPLEGIIVKFKNIATGDFYESGKSDSRGFFELHGIEKGVYLYGVITAGGVYNSDGLVGLNFKANETAKLTIAVNPYSEEAMKTMEEFYRDLADTGESYVGRVVKFDETRMMAEVNMERGIIQIQDKIRDKGLKKDFTQSVSFLERDGAKAERVLAGQTAFIRMKKRADVDDMVFVLKKKSFLPWVWTPLGAAALIAFGGTAGYVTRVMIEEDCEEVSPTKIKRK